MANFIDAIFFLYMFIGLYMLFLLVLIYFPNRKNIFDFPQAKIEPISIIVPCYNAEKLIGRTLDSLMNLNYPKSMVEITVVDDKSKDKSVGVVRSYVKKYSNIRLIISERNSGGAAEPTNIGIKNAKYDIVAVTDDDSTPDKNSLLKMVGFLQNDRKVAAVTCAVMAKNPATFIQKLQAIEYTLISWSRKLLDLVDSVYVTPGPFALYRKKYLEEVGLFDTKNMTQDIEIVWRLLSHGYKARMSLGARVYSETPFKFKDWFRQRVRWNIGGTQTLMKYKKMIFRKGMLGNFIVPFFSASLFLGIFGLGIFVYLFGRRFMLSYLSTKHSLYGGTALLYLQDVTFSPSILNYFGVVLFIAGSLFTVTGLIVMKEIRSKYSKLFNILFYMLVYLTVYPIIMITALYKILAGNYKW